MSPQTQSIRRAHWLLPSGAERSVWVILVGRGLRAFADGYMAVLLPAYLLALGFDAMEVGLLGTATLVGSALATLAIGALGHRWPQRRLLPTAAALMVGTGIGFAGLATFWPLAVVAFFGTLNPSSGDVSVFLPLEQARLAAAAQGGVRTRLLARYTVIGSLCAACGALAAATPAWVAAWSARPMLDALRAMFILYAAIGVAVWLLYRRLDAAAGTADAAPQPLGPSRRTVVKLAALFSVDAFAGGLVLHSLLALWLFERHGLSLSAAASFFFWAGLLTTASQWLAPWVAQRVGLLSTMVFTHIPANLCLIAAALVPGVEWALAFLFARSALSQMDVPTRAAYVMAVVTAPERAAAASFTAVPRSLAAAASPSLGGALLAAGALAAPLVLCGALKIAYDLALWRAFRHHEGKV
ncbi:MAG: MFS transporter [Rhodoferax sp.]